MTEDANWLYHDHLDLEDLLNDARGAARRQDWATAERLLGRLVERLKGHMRIEEEVIFPAYEQTPGTARDPTEALRNDHDAMVGWCRDMHYAVRSQDPRAFLEALQALKALLAAHDEKEERFFLPMAGHTLRDQREAILRRIEGIGKAGDGAVARVWGF